MEWENKCPHDFAIASFIAGIGTPLFGVVFGMGEGLFFILSILFGILFLVLYKKHPEIKGKWLAFSGMLTAVFYFIIIFERVIMIDIFF